MSRRRRYTEDATPDELGQHCRANYMRERLMEIPRQAVMAELLLDTEDDEGAIAVIENMIGNVRELQRTLKLFKDTRAALKERAEKLAKEQAEKPVDEFQKYQQG